MTGAGDSGGFGYLATVIASGPANMPREESVVCLPVNRSMRIMPLAASTTRMAPLLSTATRRVGELASLRHRRRKMLMFLRFRYRRGPHHSLVKIAALVAYVAATS